MSEPRRMRSGRARRQRLQDRARKGLAILPSVLTLGNLVCGFYAIVHVGAVEWIDGSPRPADAFTKASLALLLGMVFDMLDGRVARMTRSTSAFGAQLDSLADVVSFGIAPGVLVAMLHAMGRYDFALPFWSKLAWVFGAAYACGAAIRLARFNVETASHDEDAHLYFKGLPSPAAAGVVATLVLLHGFLLSDRADKRLAWVRPNLVEMAGHRIVDMLPFVALAVGYLMVSRFRYVHAANYFLRGRKPVDYLVALVFVGVVFALFPEVVLALMFCGFALSGPVLAFRTWMVAPAVAAAAPQAPAPAPPRLAPLQHPVEPLAPDLAARPAASPASTPTGEPEGGPSGGAPATPS